MTQTDSGHVPSKNRDAKRCRSKINVVAALFVAYLAGGMVPCWLKEIVFRSGSLAGGGTGFEPGSALVTAVVLTAFSCAGAFAVIHVLSRWGPRIAIVVAYCVGAAFFLSDAYWQMHPADGFLRPAGMGPAWLEYVRLAAIAIGSITGVGLAVLQNMRHAHRTGASLVSLFLPWDA